MRCRRAGFTIIEILVVIAIIVILGGMVGSAAFMARKRSAVTQVKSMLAAIDTAISMYSVDFDDWPTEGGNIVNYIGTELIIGSDKYGPYMQVKEKDKSAGGIKDAWGNDYKYDVAPVGWGNTNSYNLWSRGPDGVDNSSDGNADYGDDIYNW